ncbi:MAG: SemiSWEET family sugar transporter [Candidatus Eiseniibacteriota bacterium]
MHLTDGLGYAAAFLTTAAFVPQVVRVWRRRSADDISLAMYLLFMAGVALWALYGIRLRAAPVIAANLTTLLLAAAVVAAKIRYR